MDSLSKKPDFLEDRFGAIYRLFGRPVIVRLVLLEDNFQVVDCQAIGKPEALELISGSGPEEDESPEGPPEGLERELKAKGMMESAWRKSFK